MSHYTVAVLVADAASVDSAIATAEHMLEPYDENLVVEEYEDPLDDYSIDGMRRTYELQNAPLSALVAKMEDWTGCEGCINHEGQLCKLTTYNPKSKWDWYVVGGRWEGEYGQPGDENPNVVPLDRITPDNAPFAFILPTGQWVERGHMGWFALVTDEKSKDEWQFLIQELLKKYAGCVAVIVDCHI